LGDFKIASGLPDGFSYIAFMNNSASMVYELRYIYSGTMEEWQALMNPLKGSLYFQCTPYRTFMYVECSDGIVDNRGGWKEITEEEITAELLGGRTYAPGVYEAGTTELTKSWIQLTSNGSITVTNGQLNISDTSLSGDLFCAISGSTYFYGESGDIELTNLQEVTYSGTKSEWQASGLTIYFNTGTEATGVTVHCSDGDVVTE